MSMGRVSSNGVEERIGQLCSEFKLPTVGAEAGPRFTAAGHMDALHTLVEVLEQEAEDRRQRRIIRIRRASRLPALDQPAHMCYHLPMPDTDSPKIVIPAQSLRRTRYWAGIHPRVTSGHIQVTSCQFS